MHLVFLELDTHRLHLDFKILDENNNEVIPKTFCLQLLNKDEHIWQRNQNLSRFKPYSTTRTTDIISFEQIELIETYFLNETEEREQNA